MKKIGITTFHKAHNYGAVLQAYALSETLKKMTNFDIEFIDYYNKKLYGSYKLFKPIRKNFLKYFKQLYEDMLLYKKNKKRYESFEYFIQNNFKLSKEVKSSYDIEKYDLHYDYLITGSDQVWNKKIVGELSDIYTLNFNKKDKTKRISYAASVGDNKILLDNITEYRDKISVLDCISLRESDTCIELKKILHEKKNIETVLDPTLLLTRKEWEEFLNKRDIKENENNEKYIVAYDVAPNEEFVKIANYVSCKTGLKIIYFDKKNPGFDNVLGGAYIHGPIEFVNYIKNAEYVITTSFHATVFSIIFNKRFFVIPHKTTGLRVLNLLELLGINNRNFDTLNDFKKANLKNETDWESVQKKLNNERKKSLSWLQMSLDYDE